MDIHRHFTGPTGKRKFFFRNTGEITLLSLAHSIFSIVYTVDRFSVKKFTVEVTGNDVTEALGEGGYFPSPENLLKDFFATRCL